MQFPILYKKTSTGKIQQWEVWVTSNVIHTRYGLLGGKLQETKDVIPSGKNIGKANETTPWEQACAEAQAQWTLKKRKRHYVESIEQAEAGEVDKALVQGGIAPMLAHTYDKQGHKIKYPAYAQPKLDGHRCIAVVQHGKCTLWSRTQKPITGVPHIVRALEAMFEHEPDATIILDGELYNHDYKDKFEELSSFIRSATPKPGHEVVQYWVYDFAEGSYTFEQRHALLGMLNQLATSHSASANTIVVLPTYTVTDEEAMTAVFGAFLEQGYEGLMIRNAAGKYVNKRSYDLQKVKLMEDAEFEIVDVFEGRGAMAGRAIFSCKTAKGEIFQVKMEGSLDKLAEIWQNRADYIGRWLTVRYQNISAYGVPRFPVGVRLREDV